MSETPSVEKDVLVAHLERLADEWEQPVEGRQEYAALAFQCAAGELRALIADHEWANRLWEPSDGDTKCQECNRPNGAWFADNEVWNAVMSDRVAEWLDGDVVEGGDPGGCLCPPCFIRRADRAGIHTVWRLIPEWSGRALLMDHPAQQPEVGQP